MLLLTASFGAFEPHFYVFWKLCFAQLAEPQPLTEPRFFSKFRTRIQAVAFSARILEQFRGEFSLNLLNYVANQADKALFTSKIHA